MTLCDVCVRLFSCKPDYCIIVSPLDKPRCFWGKQLLMCLNEEKKKKKTLVTSSVGEREHKNGLNIHREIVGQFNITQRSLEV